MPNPFSTTVAHVDFVKDMGPGSSSDPSAGSLPEKTFNTPMTIHVLESCPSGIWGGGDGTEIFMSPEAAVWFARKVLNDWENKI